MVASLSTASLSTLGAGDPGRWSVSSRGVGGGGEADSRSGSAAALSTDELCTDTQYTFSVEGFLQECFTPSAQDDSRSYSGFHVRCATATVTARWRPNAGTDRCFVAAVRCCTPTARRFPLLCVMALQRRGWAVWLGMGCVGRWTSGGGRSINGKAVGEKEEVRSTPRSFEFEHSCHNRAQQCATQPVGSGSCRRCHCVAQHYA